ncbi:MAG: hypothetical protein KAI72_03065 [Candidatus Pacebacteria bacterium]|nr:hypothetical protein [Candidatus Paceibacterota bacterium]
MNAFRQQFKKFRVSHPNLYSVVIGVSIMLFWRGTWILADEFIFPNNLLLSAVVSLTVGLFILYVNDFKLKEIE